MKYDYLIIGAGLFGSVFARHALDAGKTCLVIDKRKHVAGNCYTESHEGIEMHVYGPHIFHTNNAIVWDFVNRFTSFNNYIHCPKAINNGKIYSLPFSMNTFHELWGVTSPEGARKIIEGQRRTGKVNNLEEQALSLVGHEIYDLLIKGYTEKQWGESATNLPAFIIKRLPLRFTFDSNYFNDRYQGIPEQGYSLMIERMLDGANVRLDVDYFQHSSLWKEQANTIIFTGKIDEWFGFCFGALEYRTLDFTHATHDSTNYQGVSQLNFTNSAVPHTRSIEHRHFAACNSEVTIITKETPRRAEQGDIPYYPIETEHNLKLYQQYKELALCEQGVVFGGRLAEYKYMDMHVVIESAMNKWKNCQKQLLL